MGLRPAAEQAAADKSGGHDERDGRGLQRSLSDKQAIEAGRDGQDWLEDLGMVGGLVVWYGSARPVSAASESEVLSPYERGLGMYICRQGRVLISTRLRRLNVS